MISENENVPEESQPTKIHVKCSTELDIGLLREVVAVNPFEDTEKWSGVLTNLFEEETAQSSSKEVKALQERIGALIQRRRCQTKKKVSFIGNEPGILTKILKS